MGGRKEDQLTTPPLFGPGAGKNVLPSQLPVVALDFWQYWRMQLENVALIKRRLYKLLCTRSRGENIENSLRFTQ